MSQKPNRICKYSKCTFGVDGGRKKYFACNDCDRVHSWKAIGCCFEHAMAYQDEVLFSRGAKLSTTEKNELWKADLIFSDIFDSSVENNNMTFEQQNKENNQREELLMSEKKIHFREKRSKK